MEQTPKHIPTVLDMYDFNEASAEVIERQFPEIDRGLLTWDVLSETIEDMTPAQRQTPVFLVDKTNGVTLAAIAAPYTMHIESATLKQEVNKALGHYASDEQPIIIF